MSEADQAAEAVQKLHLDEVTGERVSKSELKKRQKQRQKDAEKAEKLAKQQANAEANPTKAPKKKTDDDLTPNQYFEIRSRQIDELRKTHSPNPYPHKFQVSQSLKEFLENYKDLKRGETLPDVSVSVAGRIHAKRESGSKLKFYVW